MRRTQFNLRLALIIGIAVLFPLADLAGSRTTTLASSAEVRVLSAVGMRRVMLDLGPKFERATGRRLKVSFDSGGVILKRLEQGEGADVVMINRSGIERLSGAGRLVQGSVTDLATSVVGVAVRSGAAKPDISTPEAFRRAMLKAKTIACPDPSLGGSSGVHIAKVFERLGIAEAVKPKLVYVSTPEQEQTMPGYVVGQGKAEIALHQMQELMAVPGIDIVGPLPGALQETFVFSAAVVSDAKDVNAARALIEFLRTPDARAVIKAKGMEPVFTSAAVQERAPVKCTEDSPERRGEEGCTILASRPLVGSVAKPVYWHLDRFESLEAAKKAAGPNGVAAEAHGSVWLMTVEIKTKKHHGGRHIAWIGPLALPAAGGYMIRMQSSLLLPGATTPVHTHSGPEVFYIANGEQCLETQDSAHRLGAGQSYVLPAGVIHRGRVTASAGRRALALVLHDAAQPASHNLDDPPPLVPCK